MAVAIAAGYLTLTGAGERLLGDLRRTVGRRRVAYGELRRVTAGYDIGRFNAVLGEPASTRTDGTFRESVFIKPSYYVQAISDEDGLVVSCAITTRRPAFRPTFESAPEPAHPRLRVRLLETKFAESPLPPQRLSAGMGARRATYVETFYLGNPGHYREFALAVNDAGTPPQASISDIFTDGAYGYGIEWEDDGGEGDAAALLDEPRIVAFREAAAPNTYGVTAPSVSFADLPFPIGVDNDRVRVLPV